MTESTAGDQVLHAAAGDGIVVVRVMGRANLSLSPSLRAIADEMNRPGFSPHYVFDLGACETMDSTFMGVMAAMGMHQAECCKEPITVLNANPTTLRQMNTLGLQYILDLHTPPPNGFPPDPLEFTAAQAPITTRLDQIVHMIESHHALLDACSGNEIRFNSVLESLRESLERERSKQA